MTDIAAVIPFIANRAERARKRIEMAEELARNGYDAGPIPHDVQKLADEMSALARAEQAFNSNPTGENLERLNGVREEFRAKGWLDDKVQRFVDDYMRAQASERGRVQRPCDVGDDDGC